MSISLNIETLNGSREKYFVTSERAYGYVEALWNEGLIEGAEAVRCAEEINRQREELNAKESAFAARPGGRWA